MMPKHAEHIRSALQMPKDRENAQQRFARSPFSFRSRWVRTGRSTGSTSSRGR